MKRFINIKLAECLLKGDGLDSIEVQNMDYVLEFDEFVRSIKQNMDTKFSIFLGAGASVESGVPSAGECIWEWKRDIFISKNPVLAETHNNIKSEQVKRSIQNWLDNQGIYPPLNSEEEYSKYIEAAYKIADDRRKYFQHLIEGKSPSLGYHIIALLAENEIVKSVWTTNFDGLMLKTAHSSVHRCCTLNLYIKLNRNIRIRIHPAAMAYRQFICPLFLLSISIGAWSGICYFLYSSFKKDVLFCS